MCIRDRLYTALKGVGGEVQVDWNEAHALRFKAALDDDFGTCLLYTSDAADERSSVDLGGRRIIKKKNNEECCG